MAAKYSKQKRIKAVELVVGDCVSVKVPKEDRCKASVKQLPAWCIFVDQLLLCVSMALSAILFYILFDGSSGSC